QHLLTKDIFSELPRHCYSCSEPSRGNRLVGSFTSGESVKGAPDDGFAFAGGPRSPHYQIHHETADYLDAWSFHWYYLDSLFRSTSLTPWLPLGWLQWKSRPGYCPSIAEHFARAIPEGSRVNL